MQEPPEGFAIPDVEALRGDAPAPVAPQAGGVGAGRVAAVLERQHDRLMAIEGVVMVGQGQDEVGRDAIVVGVRQHHQLKALPPAVEGVRVVGMVIGEVDALGGAGALPGSPPGR
jgi:hypothetical protein